MDYKYQIVLVQEEGKWWAYVPDLPGVYGIGDTPHNASKDISAALELYIEV